eukprot:188647-Rhodomonas_salina.1
MAHSLGKSLRQSPTCERASLDQYRTALAQQRISVLQSSHARPASYHRRIGRCSGTYRDTTREDYTMLGERKRE